MKKHRTRRLDHLQFTFEIVQIIVARTVLFGSFCDVFVVAFVRIFERKRM